MHGRSTVDAPPITRRRPSHAALRQAKQTTDGSLGSSAERTR